MNTNLSFKYWPLWGQITLALLVICSGIVFSTGQYVKRIEQNFLVDTLKQNRQHIINTIASSSIESIIVEDIAALETLVSELITKKSDIFSLSIENEDHDTLVSQSKNSSSKNTYLVNLSEPLIYENETFGYLHIKWDMTMRYLAIEKHIDSIYLFTSMMMILLSGIIAAGIHLFITRPLHNLEKRLLGHAEGTEIAKRDKIISREFVNLYKAIKKLEELTISKEALLKEVAARKKIQKQLANARDEAIDANKTKSLFLANMSHELRTPLNGIIGYSEIICEESRELGHDNYTADAIKIINAGQHLLGLINNILDLSKIESGKMTFSIEEINMENLLRSVTETVSPLINKKENKLKLICPNEIGVIKNDEVKLKQIIFNLISNACKFTEFGIITLHISSEVVKKQDWLSICVLDTGVGISKEASKRIFDSFSQADNSTSRKYGGTGLGLTISKSFANMMGGEITVTSTLGEGSCFCIKIPAIVEEIS